MTGGPATRFAPSPTGLLHLGHAYAALIASQAAAPGRFHLRIEDIDTDRCRPEYEAAIFHDLAWLGLTWQNPVMRQSDRMPAYAEALRRLAPLCYPCGCRRGDIRDALSAPQERRLPSAPTTRAAPPTHAALADTTTPPAPRTLPAGPDGLIYPGTCRGRAMADARPGDVIRIDVARAFASLGCDRIGFHDRLISPDAPHIITAAAFQNTIGDVILSRRGMGTSYHLAVVIDDAAQRITLVTRGRDLLDATHIHVLLQRLLHLPTPDYAHHPLIRDTSGTRLAKRDNARAIRHYRDAGATPADIRKMIGL